MPGTLMRAIAIMLPGMFLSQPPTHRTPSMSCPFTAVSIESAITSRDTREYFIPSVPMPTPSVTVGKPNTCGLTPACSRAATARSTSGWMPALQGFMVEWPLATPTIGLSKSPSTKPTARSIARFGERATPCVIMRLRRLYDMRCVACAVSSDSNVGSPEYRPGRVFHRPARRALVRRHVPRRRRRRLVAGPAANRNRAGSGDAAAVRRFAVHGGSRRDPRRAARLRAVLQAGLLPGAPARDLRGVAGRDVLPRRPAGRNPRHGVCCAPPQAGFPAADGFRRAAVSARHRGRQARELHQWRALRSRHGPAVGNAVSRRGRRAASPVAALRVRAGGARALRAALVVLGQAAPARPGVGAVSHRLRRVSLHRRVRPGARQLSRLSRVRHDDGPVAVAADDRPWSVALRAQRGRNDLNCYSACSSTRATCQASRPVPSAIWCLQLVPSATTKASFEFLTAGRRLSSAIFIETA